MFQYKDGRLYCQGVSFRLPDGIYIDTCPDLTVENTIWLYSEDEKYHFEVCVATSPKPLKEDLPMFIKDMEAEETILSEACSINGLSGYRAVYRDETMTYYEVRVRIGSLKEEFNCFEFEVETAGKVDATTMMQRPEVAFILDSIRVEKR